MCGHTITKKKYNDESETNMLTGSPFFLNAYIKTQNVSCRRDRFDRASRQPSQEIFSKKTEKKKVLHKVQTEIQKETKKEAVAPVL